MTKFGLEVLTGKSLSFCLEFIGKYPGPPYRIVVQTISSRPFFKGLSFLIHLTTRSSTLNPFPLLRKKLKIKLVSKYENSS